MKAVAAARPSWFEAASPVCPTCPRGREAGASAPASAEDVATVDAAAAPACETRGGAAPAATGSSATADGSADEIACPTTEPVVEPPAGTDAAEAGAGGEAGEAAAPRIGAGPVCVVAAEAVGEAAVRKAAVAAAAGAVGKVAAETPSAGCAAAAEEAARAASGVSETISGPCPRPKAGKASETICSHGSAASPAVPDGLGPGRPPATGWAASDAAAAPAGAPVDADAATCDVISGAVADEAAGSAATARGWPDWRAG